MANDIHGQVSFDHIMRQHEEAHRKALAFCQSVYDADRAQRFYHTEIEPLLKDMSELSKNIKSVEERAWLNDVVIQWHIIGSALKIPIDIKIHEPEGKLEPPPSEKEIIKNLEERAYQIGKDRAAQREQRMRELLQDQDFIKQLIDNPRLISDIVSLWDTPGQKEADWRLAEIGLAADVIEGNINFAKEIATQSYGSLQSVWLEDVKRFKAYFLWEQSRSGWSADRGKGLYYQACRWFHERLSNGALKASTSDFRDAQRFIEKKLLSDGVLDPHKNKDAHALIERKAQRLWQNKSGRSDAENWIDAKVYSKSFYENIILAAVKHDPKSAYRVLDAIEPGRGDRRWYKIINCFEAA